MTDQLIECKRCGSNAAYKQYQSPEIFTIQCFGCGFVSNSVMTENSEFLKEQMKILPDLYKSLLVVDEDGLVWMPTNINLEQTGMIFANGSSSDNWKWAAVKAVRVKEEEKEKFKKKDGTYFEWKMNMESMKEFDEKDFLEAMDYLGLFGEVVESKK